MNEFTNNPVLKVIDEVVNECVPERAVTHIIDVPVLQMMDEVAKQHVLDDTCAAPAPAIKTRALAPDDTPALVIESTSSDRHLDEFANMFDSCIELLIPLTAHTENIEREIGLYEDLHGRAAGCKSCGAGTDSRSQVRCALPRLLRPMLSACGFHGIFS